MCSVACGTRGVVTLAASRAVALFAGGLQGGMMVLVNAFMVYTLKNRRHIRPWYKKYGPLMLTLIAAPLILADVLRHLLNDYDIWDVRRRVVRCGFQSSSPEPVAFGTAGSNVVTTCLVDGSQAVFVVWDVFLSALAS